MGMLRFKRERSRTDPQAVIRNLLLLLIASSLLAYTVMLQITVNSCMSGGHGSNWRPGLQRQLLRAPNPVVGNSTPPPPTTPWEAAQALQQEFCAGLSSLSIPPPYVDVPLAPVNALLQSGRMAVGPPPSRLNLVEGLCLDREDLSSPFFSMYVYNTSDIVSHTLKEAGEWEWDAVRAVVQKMEQLARERNVPRSSLYFIDIGANVGAYTVAVAAHGFSVIAIEAMHMNAQAIRHTLCTSRKLAKRVTVLLEGLSKEPSKCIVVSHDANIGDGTIKCGEAAAAFSQEGYSVRHPVQVVRLDDLLQDDLPFLAGKVGVMKLDIEGYEPWAMLGAQQFLQTVRPSYIVTEVSPMSEGENGVTASEYIQYMHEVGYEIKADGFDGSDLLPEDLKILCVTDATNMWLVAQE